MNKQIVLSFFLSFFLLIVLHAQVYQSKNQIVFDNLMPVHGETGLNNFEKTKMRILDYLLFEDADFNKNIEVLARFFVEPDLYPNESVLEIKKNKQAYLLQLKKTNIAVTPHVFAEGYEPTGMSFLDSVIVNSSTYSIPDSLAWIITDTYRAAVMNIRSACGYGGSFHPKTYYFSVSSPMYEDYASGMTIFVRDEQKKIKQLVDFSYTLINAVEQNGFKQSLDSIFNIWQNLRLQFIEDSDFPFYLSTKMIYKKPISNTNLKRIKKLHKSYFNYESYKNYEEKEVIRAFEKCFNLEDMLKFYESKLALKNKIVNKKGYSGKDEIKAIVRLLEGNKNVNNEHIQFSKNEFVKINKKINTFLIDLHKKLNIPEYHYFKI